MVESASSKSPRVTIVYDGPAQTAGRKEFFPSAEQLIRHFEEMDVAAVSDTIAEVCNGLVNGLGQVWSGEAPLVVDALEFTLALGAKGEVRLIAGVAGNLEGGIKLVLKRREGKQAE